MHAWNVGSNALLSKTLQSRLLLVSSCLYERAAADPTNSISATLTHLLSCARRLEEESAPAEQKQRWARECVDNLQRVQDSWAQIRIQPPNMRVQRLMERHKADLEMIPYLQVKAQVTAGLTDGQLLEFIQVRKTTLCSQSENAFVFRASRVAVHFSCNLVFPVLCFSLSPAPLPML